MLPLFASASVDDERRGKECNDNPCRMKMKKNSVFVEEVKGAIIVGAGPSGLACAACLQKERVPFLLVEKEHCIAHLWKHRTYSRLKLHTDKRSCQLPHMPFPHSYPTFVTRQQFLQYLEEYARTLRGGLLRFGESVEYAAFCPVSRTWRVLCKVFPEAKKDESKAFFRAYVGRWLVVATGENADVKRPLIPGIESFQGKMIHSSQYKSGSEFKDMKVLVVGCGNSGMEIALDLLESNARPSIVVRSPVHVLPREVLGISTYSVAMTLLKILPVGIVDFLLLLYTRFTLGDTSSCGLSRPSEGPLLLKAKTGRTPVLDVGTVAMIRAGKISVMPSIKEVTAKRVIFESSHAEEYDAIILATGYRSNVTRWLKDGEYFTEEGFPRLPVPKHWKAEGERGLYAAGLSRRGLQGSAMDAQLIARDISQAYHGNHSDMLHLQKLADCGV